MLASGIVSRILAAWLLLAAPGQEPPERPLQAQAGPLAPMRQAVKDLFGWWRKKRRAASLAEHPMFEHLAASQVGYGPLMAKFFTSPASFSSFRVVREKDGTTALSGSDPTRVLDTDVLGPIRRVWIGDFSALRETGRYVVVADNGLRSLPFDVGPAVFDAPLRAVQRSFYFQRAFTAVEPRFAEGPWVHPSDADKAPAGVRKGWHDAGDFSVYDGNVNVAIFWMLEAFGDFAPGDDDTNIPESGNGIPDLLDEARWGLEWLLSMQDSSGGFRNTACQDSYGPYGANTPDNVPPYRVGEIGTMATARAAGTLAYASTVFRRYDPEFSRQCLESALVAYGYLRRRPHEDSDGPTCPANRHDGDRIAGRQARMYAAAGLLLATGQAQYRDDFEANYVEIERIPDAAHMNGYAARLYLRSPAGDRVRREALRRRLAAQCDSALADGARNPFGWAADYYWGSIGDGFHRAAVFCAPVCLEDARHRSECEQVLSNLHYALGRNSLQFSYVSGLPGVTRGMSWSFHHWLRTLDATPHNFPGLVAGGPNQFPEVRDVSYPSTRPFAIWGYWGDPAMERNADTPMDGRYTDNDSWSTNEPDIAWQAAAVYTLHFARWAARTGARAP